MLNKNMPHENGSKQWPAKSSRRMTSAKPFTMEFWCASERERDSLTLVSSSMILLVDWWINFNLVQSRRFTPPVVRLNYVRMSVCFNMLLERTVSMPVKSFKQSISSINKISNKWQWVSHCSAGEKEKDHFFSCASLLWIVSLKNISSTVLNWTIKLSCPSTIETNEYSFPSHQ